MLHKTRGINLSFIKYRESSIIAKIYTEKFGLQSYIVNGVRSKNSKKTIGHFQPLSLLDLVVYHKAGQTIHRISEYRLSKVYQSIPFDIRKSSQAMFIAEFIGRVAGEEEEQHEQFDFAFHSLEILDKLNKGYENFHLQFVLKFTRYLGLGIHEPQDLFREIRKLEADENLTAFIQSLTNSAYDQPIQSSGNARRETLELLISYFREHYDHWHEMKSIKVLAQVYH